MPCRKGKKRRRRRRIRTSGIYESRDGTSIADQIGEEVVRLKKLTDTPGLDHRRKIVLKQKGIAASLQGTQLGQGAKKIDQRIATSLAYQFPLTVYTEIPQGYENDIKEDVKARIDIRDVALTTLANRLANPKTNRIEPMDARFAILQCNLLEMWYCRMLTDSRPRAVPESDSEEEDEADDFGGEGF